MKQFLPTLDLLIASLLAMLLMQLILPLASHSENLARPYPAPYHRAPNCNEHKIPGCIAYGGLKPRRGYERDHFLPLCLMGPDIAAENPSQPPNYYNAGNVWYQPEADAQKKDNEENELCHKYRRGKILLPDAWQQLRDHWEQ